MLSLAELSELERKAYVDARSVQRVRHGRFAAPFVNLLLLLLGLPFFLVREPTSVLEQAAKCLLNCGLAFVANFVAVNLAGASVSPALPAWIPIMVFAPLAVIQASRPCRRQGGLKRPFRVPPNLVWPVVASRLCAGIGRLDG